MHILLCDWYIIGLVLYGVMVAFLGSIQFIVYKLGTGTELDTALICGSGILLAITDFVWGTINCFVEGCWPIGAWVIIMGIIVAFITIRFFSHIAKVSEEI